MTSRQNVLLARVGLALVISELLLVILSWLFSAMRLDGVHSLLSSEGIRWFFGHFTQIIASPLLVWLLLLLVSLGCFQKSGLCSMFAARFSSVSYREKLALRISCAFLVIYIAIISLLTLMPHAILLSATGSLFPSPFSHSLIPILCFGICAVSVAYGVMVGKMHTLVEILDSMSFGIQQGAPFLVIYIMSMQFLKSLSFVFG